jgi:RNA polymerase sigma factor FliA
MSLSPAHQPDHQAKSASLPYADASTGTGAAAGIARYRDDAEWLVREYRPLVRRIAWQVHGRAARDSQLDDLMQVGMIALIEASRSYEDRGFAFATYAGTRIRGSMIDHLRRGMLSPRSAARNARRIEAARQSLYQQHGRSPSAGEMADALNLSVPDYQQLEQHAVTSQQAAIDDIDETILSAFQGVDTGAMDQLEQADMMATLSRLIGTLAERDQMVLQLYFQEELNLHEIGAVLGVTPARVCQIKAAALARLRAAMADHIDA